jgi:hypothetical protein
MGGILLGLAILELGVRLLPPPEAKFQDLGDAYVCSPTLGWRGRANYQNDIVRPEFTRLLQFNDVGMHDTNHPLPKTENTFRILWLGDSFAEAVQMAEAQTAHQQLEDLLNQRLGNSGRAFEVIMAGVSGWGTGQQLAYYREYGRHYQPDLVLVLFFVGNDFRDNLPGNALTIGGVNCFAPYFPVCEGQLDLEAWSYIPGLKPAWGSCSPARKFVAAQLSLLKNNSALFARLEPLLLRLQPIKSFGDEFSLPYTALYLPRTSEEVDYAWQVTEALLAQLNRETRADSAQFGAVIIGPREVLWLSLFDQGQLQALFQSDPHLAQSQPNRPNQRLLNFMQGQDIPALDLQQPMIDYISATGAELYFSFDRHWTAEGNRLAAELIFQWLVDNNLLAGENNSSD